LTRHRLQAPLPEAFAVPVTNTAITISKTANADLHTTRARAMAALFAAMISKKSLKTEILIRSGLFFLKKNDKNRRDRHL